MAYLSVTKPLATLSNNKTKQQDMSISLFTHSDANQPTTPRRHAVSLAGEAPAPPISWADTKPDAGNTRYMFPFNHEKELKALRRKIT